MKILNRKIDTRVIAFFLIFSILGLLSSQFNFSEIVGAVGLKGQAYFTYFQFIGPIAGGIMGSVGGVLSVLFVSIAGFILSGKPLTTPIIVSLFTMSAAALYFRGKNRWDIAIPVLAMITYWFHPNGAEVWYYALWWLVPIFATFYRNNLFLRSFGATFTAHCIGSVAYLYAFGTSVDALNALMLITPVERALFALGIAASYYAVNTILNKFSSEADFSFLNIEKKYALFRAKTE